MKRKVKFLKKKNALTDQIFIYILSLMIIALMFLYGCGIITTFLYTSKGVEHLEFTLSIKEDIKRYSMAYGDVGYLKLQPPNEVKTICFTDYNWNISQDIINCTTGTIDLNPNKIVADSFQNMPREKRNFFLFKRDREFIDSLYIGNITLMSKDNTTKCNYMCISPVWNKFSIKIVAKGDHAQISDEN
jgi:hypothetical protein